MNIALRDLTAPTAIVELGDERSVAVYPLSGASEHELVTSEGSIDACARALRQVLPHASRDELGALVDEQVAIILDLAHKGIDRVIAWISADPERKRDGEEPKGEGLVPRDVVGYIIARVARLTGRSVAQVASEPYALTLWTHAQLAEIERFDSVREMGDRLDLAHLIALSFHEPKQLSKAAHRYEEAAGLLPSVASVKARGLEILNADRAMRGLPALSSL
jgi:hypothetical protein